MTQKKDGSGNTIVQYGYDFANRLNQISVPGNPTIYFDYTVDGERYRRKDNTTVTNQFVYDSGGNLVQELDGSGNIKVYYDPGVSRKIMLTGGSSKLFLHGDLLGSVRWMSTGNAIRTEFVYDAWGNVVSTSGGDDCRYQYGGKEGYYQDPGTGLLKLGARYYDPVIGRFITKDPARDGVNWYAYAGDDPINAVDPTGLYTYKDAVRFYSMWWSGSGARKHGATVNMEDVRWRGKDPLLQSTAFNNVLSQAKTFGYWNGKAVSISQSYQYTFPSNTPEAVIFGQCTLNLKGTFTFDSPTNWQFNGKLSLTDKYDFDFRWGDVARGSIGSAGVAVGGLLGWTNPFAGSKNYGITSDWLPVSAGQKLWSSSNGFSFTSYWNSLFN